MITVTDDVLQQMVRAIVREVDPEQIWLFGSRARGEGGPDSDVDLLVVEREPFGPGRSRLEEMGRLYLALVDFRIPVDILLYSVGEVKEWRGSLNHVVARCLREGQLIYDRS
jgi:predicted nucleotidyltransferase